MVWLGGLSTGLRMKRFFHKKLLFIFREGKGGRKRGGETSMCGCLSCAPSWGPGLQPRHVPTGNRISIPLVCRSALTPLSHTCQGHLFDSLSGHIHAWVVGQVPGWGRERPMIDASLSHRCFFSSFSPFLALSLQVNNFF